MSMCDFVYLHIQYISVERLVLKGLRVLKGLGPCQGRDRTEMGTIEYHAELGMRDSNVKEVDHNERDGQVGVFASMPPPKPSDAA